MLSIGGWLINKEGGKMMTVREIIDGAEYLFHAQKRKLLEELKEEGSLELDLSGAVYEVLHSLLGISEEDLMPAERNEIERIVREIAQETTREQEPPPAI